MLEIAFFIETGAAIIFVLVMISLGIWKGRWLGAIVLGLLAILTSLLWLGGTLVGYELGNVDGAWLGLTIGLTLAGAVIMAIYLGWLGEGWLGAAALGYATLIAAAVSGGGIAAGHYLGGGTGAWIGLLLLGVIIPGIFLYFVLGKFIIRGKSGRFVIWVWLGYFGLAVSGYLAGDWLGLLLITLPAVVLFWGGLYRISYYILPFQLKNQPTKASRFAKLLGLSQEYPLRDKSQRSQAFRSLVTFTMGTNYPYYFVNKETNKLEDRVAGNPFLQFLGGPGFVYSDCEHAVYQSNGLSDNRVFEPGLHFTKTFDLEPRLIDLRPQLRAFRVEAMTKDGIPIKVVTFTPYRLASEQESPDLGQSFPVNEEAIHQVMAREFIQTGKDKGLKYTWDGGPIDGLVPLIGTRIVQDIISRYSIDELCAPFDPDHDPRVEIAEEMRNRVREAIRPYGLELVGGGISNLEPQDESIVQRRLESWQTEWESKILSLMTQGEAERERLKQTARAEAEAEIFARLSRVIQDSNLTGVALASRFIDSLGEIVSEAETQWPLPPKVRETWKQLRGELDTRQPQPARIQGEGNR